MVSGRRKSGPEVRTCRRGKLRVCEGCARLRRSRTISQGLGAGPDAGCRCGLNPRLIATTSPASKCVPLLTALERGVPINCSNRRPEYCRRRGWWRWRRSRGKPWGDRAHRAVAHADEQVAAAEGMGHARGVVDALDALAGRQRVEVLRGDLIHNGRLGGIKGRRGIYHGGGAKKTARRCSGIAVDARMNGIAFWRAVARGQSASSSSTYCWCRRGYRGVAARSACSSHP